MLKKLLAISGIVLTCVFYMHFSKTGDVPTITSIQADDPLITPQEIEFFDTNGDPLDYVDWFTQALDGSPVNPANIGYWFGTYQFLPKDDGTVYLAAGIDRPAGQAGGAIGTAVVRNGDPTQMTLNFTPVVNREVGGEPITYVEEDGIHEMDIMANGNILIAGTDPAMGDQTGGNAYILDTSSNELTKIRCSSGEQTLDCVIDHSTSFVFPNVIHFFGISVLGDDIYMAGSTNPTMGGVSDPVVYKSSDNGATWQETWLNPSTWYRIKDIIAFSDTYNGQTRSNVYADLVNTFGVLTSNAPFLSTSTLVQPAGYDWTQLYSSGGRAPHSFVKGTLFNGVPIYNHYNGTSLFKFRQALDGSYAIDDIPLVGLTIGQTNGSDNYYKHNAMVEIDDYLYIIADDNDIYKSNLVEPITWTKVAEIDDGDHIITLNYWEDRNALLAASHGTDAKNFYIPLPDPEPQPTPTPTPSPSPSFSTARVKGITCEYDTPKEIPNLFAAVRTGNKVELQFSPVRGTTGYYVSYGLDTSLNQFGTNFTWSDESGVIKYSIYDLDPKKTYSFSVRAQNHCQPGFWSNIVTVKPN